MRARRAPLSGRAVTGESGQPQGRSQEAPHQPARAHFRRPAKIDAVDEPGAAALDDLAVRFADHAANLSVVGQRVGTEVGDALLARVALRQTSDRTSGVHIGILIRVCEGRGAAARRWLVTWVWMIGTAAAADPLVIAHRGASGYLPEHTLAAFAMAYAQGADYLEPDLMVTADGRAVALHDTTLDAVSDVRTVFPGRARADGLHYVVDFTLEELRRLNLRERRDPLTGTTRHPGRFPADLGRFSVVTLEELIELVLGLNRSTGRTVGIYPELKAAAFHAAEGKDITAIVLATLERYGYRGRDDGCIVQSFEAEPLIRLRREFGSRLPLVQLLGDDPSMYTVEGLTAIARYADGVGAPTDKIVTGVDGDGQARISRLVHEAKALGLFVHAYTFRADVTPYGMDFEAWLTLFLEEIGVGGVFTDHPDLAVAVVRRRAD
jgi:glycerophosphoryl diester phosphodiesterase